jgi:hypothetical protein
MDLNESSLQLLRPSTTNHAPLSARSTKLSLWSAGDAISGALEVGNVGRLPLEPSLIPRADHYKLAPYSYDGASLQQLVTVLAHDAAPTARIAGKHVFRPFLHGPRIKR